MNRELIMAETVWKSMLHLKMTDTHVCNTDDIINIMKKYILYMTLCISSLHKL